MFKKKLTHIVIYVTALVLLSGAGTIVGNIRANGVTPNNNLNSMAESAYGFSSINDLVKNHSLIASVEVLEKGKPYGKGNGVLTFGDGRAIDTNEYFIETKAKVLKVIKGDDNLAGETITVTEHIGPAPDTVNEFIMGQSGKYLLFINKDEKNNSFYETDPSLTKYKINDKGVVESIKSSTDKYVPSTIKNSINGKGIDEIIDMVKSYK